MRRLIAEEFVQSGPGQAEELGRHHGQRVPYLKPDGCLVLPVRGKVVSVSVGFGATLCSHMDSSGYCHVTPGICL